MTWTSCDSFRILTLVLLGITATGCFAAPTAPAPIQVKVVVIAMFEVGKDSGDGPGELQYWVERDHLTQVYPLPSAYHDALMNDQGELAIVTGQGTAHAAATVMALGLDPRFDLTHAYFLIAGIAGGNPQRVSLGSAVWANWIVDTDLSYEIDAREIPADFSTGHLPLRKQKPFEAPAAPMEGQLFQTNRALTQWAYELTKATPLTDSDKLKEIRTHFDPAAAHNPPQVLLGDEVTGSAYWHGKLLDARSDQWMDYFTNGQGKFATTAMEDSGSLESLKYLANAGKVDYQRILVLRTVSNFDQQPKGMDAVTSLQSQRIGQYGAFLPSLEAAYTVGHVVVADILKNWEKYRETIPAAAK